MGANSPKPGDTNNTLLSKLLRLFGGDAQPADTDNNLLRKIVSTAEISTVQTLAYAASVAVDFSGTPDKTISITGDLALTSSNLAVGREVSIRIVADGSARTLTFPAGWVFLGTKPTQIAANKTGVLSLKAYGSADSDVVAAYSEEA